MEYTTITNTINNTDNIKINDNDIDGWDLKPDKWETLNDNYSNIDYNITTVNNNQIYSTELSLIDGIFVLAGGIDKSGKCHDFVIYRLNLAFEIHKMIDKPIFCLGGGSYHVPPILNRSGFTIHESTSCSEYLIALGVKSSMIYKEWSSYDTIANGFFAFSNFIIPLRLKNILIITSEFHMERSRIIFEWMKQVFQQKINITYKSTSNNNIDPDVLQSRIMREKSSSQNLQSIIIPNCNTIDRFHKWFFTEHKAYNAVSELNRTCDLIDETIKKSY